MILPNHDKLMFPATYNYEFIDLSDSGGITKAITLQSRFYERRIQFRMRRIPQHPSAQITTYLIGSSGMTVQQMILTQQSYEIAPNEFTFNPIEKISTGAPGDSIIIETGQEYQHIVESMAMTGRLTDFLALHVTHEWGNSILDFTPVPGYRYTRPTSTVGQEPTRKRTLKSLLNQNTSDTQNSNSPMQSRQLSPPSQPTEKPYCENALTSQNSPQDDPTDSHDTQHTSSSSDTSTSSNTQRLLTPSVITKPPKRIRDPATPIDTHKKHTTKRGACSEPITKGRTRPDNKKKQPTSHSQSYDTPDNSLNKQKKRRQDIDIIIMDEITRKSCIMQITGQTEVGKVLTTARQKLAINKSERRYLYYKSRFLLRGKVKTEITPSDLEDGRAPLFTLTKIRTNNSDSSEESESALKPNSKDQESADNSAKSHNQTPPKTNTPTTPNNPPPNQITTISNKTTTAHQKHTSANLLDPVSMQPLKRYATRSGTIIPHSIPRCRPRMMTTNPPPHSNKQS